ncbi:MAG: response regulator [Candidatus Omnitrophica bacterium]|nr:response regulator [Candidatus Omnitrophota bacterium]
MSKILVVDDDTTFIKMVRALLEKRGYEVIAAGEGREGLEKTRSEKPDLILLDVMMPIMDGYTMLQEVKKDEKIKDTPVILCTGTAQKEYVEATQGMGVESYITKPIESVSFLARVEELLKKP